MTQSRRQQFRLGTFAVTCGLLVIALVFCSVAGAKPAVVTTRDGQRFEGDVTESDTEVVIDIRGVKTVIPRANVGAITYPEAFEKQFRDRLAALDAKDVKGRIDLARWAMDQQQYNAARDALDSALAIDPNNREAYDLQNLVRGQQRLQQQGRAGAATAPAARTETAPVPLPPGAIPPGERRLLTNDDINIIRQRELKPSDAGVAIRFDHDVKNRFIKSKNIQLSQFNSLKPVDQALQILTEGDPSMRQDVKVMSDPRAITDYQRVVQPLVINNCATGNCHGSNRGGNFMIYVPADNANVTYTNFYILNKYAKKMGETTGGVFGGAAERRLIDRGQPNSSLLLQYSLPANVSDYDHPKVTGYDGVFRTKKDVNYQRIETWITQVLTPVPPDYGIRYDIPGSTTSGPASAPATAPASAPVSQSGRR